MKRKNLTIGISVSAILVSILIAVFSHLNTEEYKDKLKISKAVAIHSELKYKVERFLNISQEIMQDKISISYIHNNLIKAINITKKMQYEMQYKISSYPKNASLDISKMKEAIKKTTNEIKNKLVKLEESKMDIKETFEKLELYENNSNVSAIKKSYIQMFEELNNSMKVAYDRSLNIQKNISTFNDILIIDNENRKIPDNFFLPLENDEKIHNILEKGSKELRENLDVIDPRIL